MTFAESTRFLPGAPAALAVTLKTETSADGPATYLLDVDPERIRDRLCAANPEGFGEKEWKEHFPHLPLYRSCD